MIWKTLVLGILIASNFTATASSLTPNTLKRQVLGGIQFWTRDCSLDLECPLPTARGEVAIVRGEISKPEKPTELGYFTQSVEHTDFKIDLHIYWKNPTNEVPHFVYQERLWHKIDSAWQPVAECSSYTSDEAPRAFPIGACSGYVKEGELIRQIGVSFIKAP